MRVGCGSPLYRMTTIAVRLLWCLDFLTLLCLESTQVLAHDAIGEVNPAQVKIAIGANINITCRMTTSNINENNSSCLSFYEEHSNTPVPKEHINIINESAIGLLIKNPPNTNTTYICKCNNTTVGYSNIISDYAITDYKCFVNNFKSMTCSFTNPSNTKYKLISDSCTFHPTTECITDKCKINCVYKPVKQYYNFIIVANNSLNMSFSVNQFSRVIPPKPEDVKVTNLTSNSVTLHWRSQKYSHYTQAGGFHHEIQVRPCNGKWTSVSNRLIENDIGNFSINIKNLENAFRPYEYSIRMMTKMAFDAGYNDTWSKKFIGNFVTKSRKPDRAPEAYAGSYYIESENQIKLFWKPLLEFEKNGPKFQYNVTRVEEDGNSINTTVKTDNYSALANFTWKNTSNYKFEIRSQNEEGQSLDSAVVKIISPIVKDPIQTIAKIYNQQNQTYTVMWMQPIDKENLSNFTLFYCVAKIESKNNCVGEIYFVNLNKTELSYTSVSNETLNFALSENYQNYSTGMIWAMCDPHVIPNVSYEVPNVNITSLTDKTIKLRWKSDCWDSIILKKYNLTYCITENSEKCIDQNITSIIISKTANSFKITDLKPSTIYKIWIRMVSPDNEGSESVHVIKTYAENDNTKTIIIIVSLISLILPALVIGLYGIKRKLHGMMDIRCELPGGMVNEYKKEKKPKMFLQRLVFVLFYKKENITSLNHLNELAPLQGASSRTLSSVNTQMKCVNNEVEYVQPSTMAVLLQENPSSKRATEDENNAQYVLGEKLSGVNQRLKFFWFILIAMCLTTSSVSAHDYVGEVIPHHVELPIGGSVNITCRMNRSYFDNNNSSCLSFSDHGNVMVPKEQIHVVNDSSIVFMVRNATEQSARYICKCHDKGVYVSNIYVGRPPTDVTDFQCRGYDFSFMTCNFTVPENRIYTDYRLKFTTSSPDYIYTCNLENGLQPSERICNITVDKNSYRIVYQYYKFELTSNNSLGTLTQSIMIDQYSRIVPARPNVEIENVTTNSVTFNWIVAKFSQYSHTDGLQYEIRLRPEKFDWFYIDTNKVLQINDKDYKAQINNLQYSFRRYDVSVRVKTVRANKSDETMWSEPFEGFFYTKPRRPERAPNMDVGSFYIDPTEQNIRLYWQQLAEYEENGPDFQYNITEVRRDGKLINAIPTQTDSTSATYEWQRTSHYEFKLQSQNQIGMSMNTSILEVHPSRKRSLQIEQIQVITKVYHNQSYTITWRQPSDMNNLSNFTLFWCISKMESQSQCKGTINFKHFDKYTTNHTTEPQNHTLNFAVSANYDTYSTGMMWAMCTADGATDLTKMDPETTPISSHSIKVQWSTECLYMAILEGYNLTYCKVDRNVPDMIGNCIDLEKTVSISKSAKEYTITGLEPFTTYKISILMYSKLKIGPMSNPVTETTTEDAPSAPRRLKKYNVTSNSVRLSWLPPQHSNGNLRFYTIWYKNESTPVMSTPNDTESEITYELGSLYSYSDYKIYVTAHTVKSSGPSNDIHLKTLIGIPSNPLSFNMNRNDKELLLSWSPPKLPSGRVEFYEVRVTVRKNNESETLKTSRVVGNVCKMNIPCYDPNNSYIFDVRAVNVADKSEVDYHTFSKRDTSYFNAIHQGAAKRRRHSNAEINTSIGTPYQIHGTTEKHLRHRHERENFKLIQTTEPSFVTQISSAIDDEIQEDSNEDFICIGGERETLKILKQYKDASQYKLFYSSWQNGPFFACSETKFSKLTMVALVVIVVTMLLMVTFYYARKKYTKMSSIGLVIPEGLEDNIHISKGVDNTIERDEIIRNDELFYEKENHRLLSKVSNDSGFLNSVQCLDKSSVYACSDHQDSEKSSQSTDSVELNDITSCSYTSSPSHSPNANIRESTIPEERSNSPAIQPSVQLRPCGNGYIKPIMMTNGYVQPQAFQKLQPREAPSFNGYTTLDAMGKPVFPQSSTSALAPTPADRSSYEIVEPKNVNNKDIVTPHPVNGNICGYVTHKQLSDFGQRLQ